MTSFHPVQMPTCDTCPTMSLFNVDPLLSPFQARQWLVHSFTTAATSIPPQASCPQAPQTPALARCNPTWPAALWSGR